MLKKVLLLLIVFSTTVLTAFADKVPTSSKSIRHYGIGLYKVESDFYVFDKPDANARKIYHFILPSAKKSAIVRETRKNINPYVVNIPTKNEFYTTVYEYPENGWMKIYYNQNGKETGWVKLPSKSNFLTWKEFVYKYGKKNGLKLMRDVPSSSFKLYSQDSEDAQVVDTFTYPEYIALRMIRGNWMLVTVVDTGTVYKTGWFKWRTDNGELRVFPKMN